MATERRTDDACELADDIRAGRRRAVDVAAASLETIDRLNGAINAFVRLRPADDVLREAEEIDERVAAGGDPGPFAGVPIGVKDLEDAAGLPTSHGSWLGSDDHATVDSVQVSRLRAAGAIVLGKTNTPEFGYSLETRNRRFGQTKNPRDLRLTPGGSSGGSAAAVASGMVPLATASDGGGSIRIPAAFCGLPGLKPTAGRIPADPDTWGDLTQMGSLSVSFRDQARFLDVVAGPSPDDRRSLPRSETLFEPTLEQPLDLGSIRAVATTTLCRARVEPAVEEAFGNEVERLARAGMDIRWASDPLPDVRSMFTVLAAYRDAMFVSTLAEDERVKLSRGFIAWSTEGERVTLGDVVQAEAQRERLYRCVEDLLASAEMVLSPTVGVLPWTIGSGPPGDPFDVLLTHAFNLTGHPAISIPTLGEHAGVQAVAARFAEAFLLRFGLAASAEFSS